MKRIEHKEKDGRWCDLEIELKDGRLSICGSEGRIITQTAGKREALEYWKGFFEESPAELGRMAIEYGKRTPLSAARFVLQSDGDFHGLDVHRSDGKKLYITESCGQIRESLQEWFPESAQYFDWHLNDMKAGTVAQEAELEKHEWDHHGSHYDWACVRLDEAGLLIDNGYKYGSAWLKRDLPADVIAWAEGRKAA